MDYRLPKTIEQIKILGKNKSKENNEKLNLSLIYNDSLENLKLKLSQSLKSIQEIKNMPVHRIDGILFLKKNKELIILTEFFIFYFVYENNAFNLIRNIAITSIDYVTLTRNGNKMILHLVSSVLNKNLKNNNNFSNNNSNSTANTRNFVLNYKQLEKVVGCIASTYFYDKQDFGLKKEFLNRHISVIIVNENFEIFDDLEKIKNFDEYK